MCYRIGFCDLENVGHIKYIDIAKYNKLIIFMGHSQRQLSLGALPKDLEIEIVQVESSTPDSLDRVLCMYFGVEHLKQDSSVTFDIISGDKGFDSIISHSRRIGRSCMRVKPSHLKSSSELEFNKHIMKKKIDDLGKSIDKMKESIRPKTLKGLRGFVRGYAPNKPKVSDEFVNDAINRLIDKGYIKVQNLKNGQERIVYDCVYK